MFSQSSLVATDLATQFESEGYMMLRNTLVNYQISNLIVAERVLSEINKMH